MNERAIIFLLCLILSFYHIIIEHHHISHCFPHTSVILHSWQVYINYTCQYGLCYPLPHCVFSCWSTLAARLAPAETNNASVGAGAEAPSIVFLFHFLPFPLVLPTSYHLISSTLPTHYMHILPNVKSCPLTYCSVFFSFSYRIWSSPIIYMNFLYFYFFYYLFCWVNYTSKSMIVKVELYGNTLSMAIMEL